ncbi:MAG: beta-glucosidase BglX [Saprospiraceae bacterium]|nr:beta-glucosidase BglX [Saprospiraceae bacterium]
MKIQKFLIISICLFTTFQSFAQNDTKKMDKFIKKLMKQMTIEEKIGQLNLVTPGDGILTGSVVSKGVEENIEKGNVGGLFGIHGPEKIRKAQNLAMKSRLKIPLLFGSDVIHGYETTFPIPFGTSFSWDLNLIEKSARIAAQEASANGINWTFSPMVDIARDPRWGRVAETAGEDAYLGSQIAKAMVRGYQGDDLSKNNTILSCVKHFALYGAAEAGRDYNTTDMSKIKMYQDYLPPYKAAIDAGAGSVMSSFNDIDGVPATGNKWLLNNLLRDQWGFNGFVVSDYTAVNEMISHGLGDLQTVSALALNAGLDMDMVGEGFLTTLKKSLSEGKVSEKQIDAACRRILEAKYKLGLFDDPFRYIDEKRPANEILTEENRRFARNIAAQSCVLLKNKNNLLPLTAPLKISLTGPLANDKSNMLGTWAVTGDPQKSVTIYDGIRNLLGSNSRMIYTKGCNISDDSLFAKHVNVFGTRIEIDKRSNEEMLKETDDVSRSADAIVAILGEASEMSGESASRSNLDFPASQIRLLKSLKKTGMPLVVVVIAGRPIILDEVMEIADALIFTGHLGTEAGGAIADVLFGNYNPSGKLTMTFPRNVGQIPIYYNRKNTGRPQSGVEFEKFKSNYLDVANSPFLPFGYGLSYTNFEYGDIQLDKPILNDNEPITASITIQNTGRFNGNEVVQMYIRDYVGSVSRPLKELKGFQKVFLKQGEKKTITFKISKEDLKFYNSNLDYVAEEGDFKLMIGTNSDSLKEINFSYKPKQ